MSRELWLAGPDGIAHLHLAGGRVTACHAEPVSEQWAWPTTSRCPDCEVGVPWQIRDPDMPAPCTCPACVRYDGLHAELRAAIAAGRVEPDLRERVREAAAVVDRTHGVLRAGRP